MLQHLQKVLYSNLESTLYKCSVQYWRRKCKVQGNGVASQSFSVFGINTLQIWLKEFGGNLKEAMKYPRFAYYKMIFVKMRAAALWTVPFGGIMVAECVLRRKTGFFKDGQSNQLYSTNSFAKEPEECFCTYILHDFHNLDVVSCHLIELAYGVDVIKKLWVWHLQIQFQDVTYAHHLKSFSNEPSTLPWVSVTNTERIWIFRVFVCAICSVAKMLTLGNDSSKHFRFRLRNIWGTLFFNSAQRSGKKKGTNLLPTYRRYSNLRPALARFGNVRDKFWMPTILKWIKKFYVTN